MKNPYLIILNKFIYKPPAIKISISALGEWVLNTGFIQEGSALRSNPLPFYIQFLDEKVPLSYAFYCQNGYPLFRPLQPLLNAENALSLKY